MLTIWGVLIDEWRLYTNDGKFVEGVEYIKEDNRYGKKYALYLSNGFVALVDTLEPINQPILYV